MNRADPCEAITQLELPARDAAHYYRRLAGLAGRAWLDSGGDPGTHILVADPLECVSLSGGDNDFAAMRQLLHRLEVVQSQPDIPFCGGLLGYFGYEINHQRQGLKLKKPETDLGQFGLYDWALLVDATSNRARLVFHPQCSPKRRIRVQSVLFESDEPACKPFRLKALFACSQTRESYEGKVARIVQYLEEGDCYQVNLSQAFHAPYSGNLLEPYLALRNHYGAPHGALIEFERGALMSLSPERFLKVDGRLVETWPIKGTAPRAADPEEDKAIARQLLRSEKNRAENLMIVDLMRNDLSQVCLPGSINARQLHQLHSFALVHHLVSCVEGLLAPEKDSFDLFSTCLPGGSITGAPKRRAMQIIDELEASPRGAYCGSVAYFSRCGRCDSSIAIRTFSAADGLLEMRGGGGVVVDSSPASEYQETLDKVSGYLSLLQQKFPPQR